MAIIRGVFVDAETDFPIFRSVVELRTLDWELVAEKGTDNEGGFEFRDVKAGKYYLVGSSVIHTPVKAEISVVEPGVEYELRAVKAIVGE